MKSSLSFFAASQLGEPENSEQFPAQFLFPYSSPGNWHTRSRTVIYETPVSGSKHSSARRHDELALSPHSVANSLSNS